MTTDPRVLIEDWLPVAELGIESRRERAAASALPPLSFLHVWWARRPLVASAAVVLAGLLPAWSQDLADDFPDAPAASDARRPTARGCCTWSGSGATRSRPGAAYRRRCCSRRANPQPIHATSRPTATIPSHATSTCCTTCSRDTWGEMPLVADPTAGGGSIPFTATRLGIPTIANDLNGVAAAVLEAGVEIPARRRP